MQPAAAHRLWAWRVAFSVALAGVLWLALAPLRQAESDWFENADKLRHAAAFAVLWCLGAQSRWLPAWALGLFLLAFGAAIEVAQSMTVTREAAWMDWAADAAGLALGMSASRCLYRPPSVAQP